MKLKVNNNQPFQSVTDSISFYAADAVELSYSVDGFNYVSVDLSAVTYPDNIVVKCKEGTFFKIGNITDGLIVNN